MLGWADELRRLKVRANADTPEDAAKAREFGAQGIGLCRTEHMFMAEDRLPIVREMILAREEDERRAALDRLLPMQQGDFEGIFEAMAGLPSRSGCSTRRCTSSCRRSTRRPTSAPGSASGSCTSRTRCSAPAAAGSASSSRRSTRCRCGRSCAPRARCRSEAGEAPLVEIMHPLVGFAEELRRLRELTERVAAEEPEVAYLCGTMIELPRACLRADEIAEVADFFSFGTNDLTQTALGFSRDDAEGKFLTWYLEHGVLARNPFETLDVDGVGDLMRIAVERGRSVKADLKLGICGEHGGEPRSVEFCHRLGLDYVSCSPYRVPLARLAAAQAALREGGVEAVAIGG